MVKSNIEGRDMLSESFTKLHISELASVVSVAPRRKVHQVWRRRDSSSVPTSDDTTTSQKVGHRNSSRIRHFITTNQAHNYQLSIPASITTPVVKRVSDVDWSRIRPPRAGIVVYTRVNDELLLCFGIDATYKTATDFGGGVSYRRDGTALQGALRELSEESLSIFDPIASDRIQNGLAIYDEITLIIFIHLDVDPVTINGKFEVSVKKQPSSELEISEILWLNVSQMQVLLDRDHDNGGMYNRARILLRRAGDFYRQL
jgi:hypothetical protein